MGKKAASMTSPTRQQGPSFAPRARMPWVIPVLVLCYLLPALDPSLPSAGPTPAASSGYPLTVGRASEPSELGLTPAR